ncbi:alpha-keto acid decarboxylase family protein [Lactobacillaceae bacterium Scapto_B20]
MTEYTISDYLLDVIKHLDADQIFGVPGDYNLQFLDHITHRDDMKWVGNANELNASYMADGYAREKGFATFVTTFGVGELSAINGLSGSIAEHVPVLEIVGAPTTTVINDAKLVHHTFGDHNFNRFENAHQNLGIKVTVLNQGHAIDQINDTLRYIATTKQPAYLVLPSDLVNIPVNVALKNGIANLFKPQPVDVKTTVDQLTKVLNQAKHPVIIVGHEVQRFNLGQAVEQFATNNNIPIVDLGLGKAAVNEHAKTFVGTYNGTISDDSVNQFVKDADDVILIGAKLTDSVTGGFTHQFNDNQVIELNANLGNIFGVTVKGDYDFTAVINELANVKLTIDNAPVEQPAAKAELSATNKPLTQAFYDQAMAKFIGKDDTLVAEQGTSFFGLASEQLATGSHFIGQPLWGSIGYAFPAALGSQIAEPNRRTVLSTGEGSLQLTIQEFGLAFRERLNPIVFIIENTGYTVERVIHGMNESYNDVPKLKYDLIPTAFGGDESNYQFINVNTEQELLDAMTEARDNKDKLVVVQSNMAIDDAPAQLIETGKRFEAQNH